MRQTSRPEIALEETKRLGARGPDGEATLWRVHSPSMAGATGGYLFVAAGPGEAVEDRPTAHRDCCRVVSCRVKDGVMRPNFAEDFVLCRRR